MFLKPFLATHVAATKALAVATAHFVMCGAFIGTRLLRSPSDWCKCPDCAAATNIPEPHGFILWKPKDGRATGVTLLRSEQFATRK
jgi:hypothetical protein